MIVTIAGLPTACSVLGSGRLVVMLHGWRANMQCVEPLARRLSPLGYRVYTLDLPGFGATPPPPVPWSVHDYARFVLAFFDHHELDRVFLFGHSFGGRLGLVLGADHPSRLIKIALSNSAGVRKPPSRADRLRRSLYRATYRATLSTPRAARLRRLAERLSDWYRNRYGSADYRAAQGVMRETFVRVVSEDLLPYAARVSVPTLLFWGDRDDVTPLWQGRLLEQTIPDAGLVLWEGAGHYSYLDRLGDTARVMDHFFTDTSDTLRTEHLKMR
ncbi:MAG: alpha/beta fold hydrolase [Aggregatilineales bacterium]